MSSSKSSPKSSLRETAGCLIPAREEDFFFACFSWWRAWYLATESFSVEPLETAVLVSTAEVVVPAAEAAGEACASARADGDVGVGEFIVE
ncbi:hypothetical protein P3T76_011876 [Phytophthora citrophthora]|uniref:Uncharacterized protein n=1 Tax=Phytophthora citrophthora TaxID=4793 RepID=A0AAD9G899_9STRA|nr:hypothetical protein P3T76_011876 [Phytophthora citrophthora]